MIYLVQERRLTRELSSDKHIVTVRGRVCSVVWGEEHRLWSQCKRLMWNDGLVYRLRHAA